MIDCNLQVKLSPVWSVYVSLAFSLFAIGRPYLDEWSKRQFSDRPSTTERIGGLTESKTLG